MEEVELLSLPDVAERLGIPVNRVHQALREGELVAVTENGVRRVPALLLQDGGIVKSLRAVITQLRDAHFSDDEIVGWLFRTDDTLAGAPIELLRAGRGADVRRQAQLAGF